MALSLINQHGIAAAASETPRRVTILGSTGSVGCNTLDLIERRRDEFDIEALTAYQNVEKLADQARRLGSRAAVIGDEAKYQELKAALSGTDIEVSAGA